MSIITDTLKKIVYDGLEYFNKYYSEYRGFVVDNDDPKGQGRIRLVVPGIIDDPSDYWAPSIGTFSGNGYGSHVIPPVNTLVWVIFETGDPNKPVWKHGYFGNGHIPKNLQDVNNYWFKTPGGHLIEMDDSKEEVRVTDSKGNLIVLTSKGISLVPKGSNVVYLGSKDKGAEPGVLGDTLEKILIPLMSNYMSMGSAMAGLASSVAQNMTNMAPSITSNQWTAGLVASINTQAQSMSSKATEVTSTVNTLNESISDLIGQLPGIKSKKVKLDR